MLHLLLAEPPFSHYRRLVVVHRPGHWKGYKGHMAVLDRPFLRDREEWVEDVKGLQRRVGGRSKRSVDGRNGRCGMLGGLGVGKCLIEDGLRM